MPDRLLPPPPDLLDGASLFLDFDGTLVELAEEPDSVEVPVHLPDLLSSMSERLNGRIAIISGRAVERLERFGLSGHTLAGSHGAEVRHRGAWLSAPEPPASMPAVGERLDAFACGQAGALVERKRHGIALHYRQAPQLGAAAEALASELAEAHGLQLQQGKMMVELRAKGADKGAAMRQLMGNPPFAGHPPIVLGDDVTDEAAFTAAAELGGFGVLIGAQQPTAARYRLADVAAVHRWLEQAAAP